MTGVRWSSSSVQLYSGGMSFDLQIDSSDLRAVNGARDGEENHLIGDIVVDGEAYSIDGDLDPDYDAEQVLAAFTCIPSGRPATAREPTPLMTQSWY